MRMRPLSTKVTYGDNIATAQSYHQPKWKIRTTAVYRENITLQRTEKETGHKLDPGKIIETINKFQQITISAANKVFGIPRLQNIKKCPAPWWNEECKIAMQGSRHSFNRAKKILQTKTKRANFGILIERNTKQSWRNCISPINPQIPTSVV